MLFQTFFFCSPFCLFSNRIKGEQFNQILFSDGLAIQPNAQ